MNKSFLEPKILIAMTSEHYHIKNISIIDRFVHVLIFSQLDYFKSLSTCL